MRRYYSIVLCISLLCCLVLTSCGTSSDNSVKASDVIDAEYVLDCPLPPNPTALNTSIAVVTRLIFFADGNCRCFYTILRTPGTPTGDGESSSYCKYSYSSKTNYICLDIPYGFEYHFTFSASDNLEKITAENGTYLKKVK